MTRRLRAVAMLGAAVACAGVAVSAVRRERERVRVQVGDLTPVVVAARPVRRGALMTPARVSDLLAERKVPRRFVPSSALSTPVDATGLRTSVSLAAGDYVTDNQLTAARPGGEARQPGSARLVEISVSGAATLSPLLHPGTMVDVLITTGRERGPARTYLALQRIELAGFSAGADADSADGSPEGSGTATLRVSLRQAVLLTAAQSFARELRLVPRPSGDMRVLGRTLISEREL
jgi:pilus assembly protein CpaB